MKLSKREGIEGPKQDPYAYVERTVTYEDSEDVITLHEGLGVWLKVNGELNRHREEGTTFSIFELLTGLSINRFDRYYNRIHGPYGKCPKCGCHKLISESGYPGESFEICVKCGHVVNCHFNESAVM